MAHPDVIRAIVAHVRANWPHTPTFEEDAAEDQPIEGGPFLVITFPWSRSEQTEMGEIGTFEEEGAANLTMAVPRGTGTQQPRAWLEALAATFRGRQIGPVWSSAPQSPVLDDDRDDTTYVRLMMAVPYRFNVSG